MSPTDLPKDETTLERSDDHDCPGDDHTQDTLLERIDRAATKFRADIDAALDGFQEPSQRSVKVYMRIYERIRRGESLNSFATAKGTYYQARGAFIYGCCMELQDVARSFDVGLAANDYQQVLEVSRQGKSLLADLKTVPPDRFRQRCRENDYFGDFRQLAGDAPTSKPNGKRRGLTSLPKDWRSDVVAAAAKARSAYLLPIAVLMASACRPVEVEKGLNVRVDGDGAVVCRIKGAKCDPGKSGQEWREVVVKDDGSLEVKVLKQAIEQARLEGRLDANGALEIRVRSAKGLGAAVSRYGEGVSTPSHRVSAYSARHQGASDLKGAGASYEERATVLGHLVDRTCQMYGNAASGSGKRRLTARAARPVKTTRSDPVSLKRRKPKPK
jgi:hypothetical protein